MTILKRTLMSVALMILLTGCSKSPEFNLRLSNPSSEVEISGIQVYLDNSSVTGGMKLTLGPHGVREYGGVHASSGELLLVYRYADSNTPSEFKTNLLSQLGAEYSGTIQLTFLSSDDIDVNEVVD